MKIFFALVLLLSAALLPDRPASVAEHYETSAAELSERDPLERAQPAPNEQAAPLTSEAESVSPPDLDTPMIFQRGERGRGSVEDIIAYWEENGYPENLSFIAETGGEMIDGEIYTSYDVGLVNDSEEKRGEILDIAGSNCVLRFAMGANALWERELHFEKLCWLAVQEDDIGILEVRFYKNSDLITVVVSGSEKTYQDRFSKQFGGAAAFVNERNVVEAVDGADFVPANSEDMIANYIEKTPNAEVFHADIFLKDNPDGWQWGQGAPDIVEGMDMGGPTTICGSGSEMGLGSPLDGTVSMTAAPAEKSAPIWLFVVGAAALVLAAIAAIALRIRLRAGSDGTAAARGGAENKIISAIKSAEEQPDPRLLEKIKDNITK